MRTFIPLLVLSLVFSPLSIRYEAIFSQLSSMLLANSGSQKLLQAELPSIPNSQEEPIPHRGSGRRDLRPSFINACSVV